MKRLACLSLTVGLLSVPIQAQTQERLLLRNPLEGIEQQATKRPVLRNPLEGIEQQATKRPVLRNPLEGMEQQAREAEARRMFEEQNRMIENARRREPGQNAIPSTRGNSDAAIAELERRRRNADAVGKIGTINANNTIRLIQTWSPRR